MEAPSLFTRFIFKLWQRIKFLVPGQCANTRLSHKAANCINLMRGLGRGIFLKEGDRPEVLNSNNNARDLRKRRIYVASKGKGVETDMTKLGEG